MNNRIFLCGLLSIISLFPLAAMDNQVDTPSVSKRKSWRWPAFIYWEPFPGSILYEAPSQDAVDRFKLEAFNAEKLKATEISEKVATQLDWVYALAMIEKKGLLEKPFVNWTIEDIKTVSCWLTRLTVKNPGKFRTKTTVWEMELPTVEDSARLTELVQKPQRNSEENAFVRRFFHWFPEAPHVESLLTEKLELIQNALKKACTLKTATERNNTISRLAGLMHYEIVWVHAFGGAHKRLGRVIMFIILMQNNLQPFTFYDENYIEVLKKAIAADDGHTFLEYCYECQLKDAHLRANPRYYEMLKEVCLGNNDDKRPISLKLLTHPLNQHRLGELVENSSKVIKAVQKTTTQDTQKNILCDHCGKEGSKTCGRCKMVRYCSTECQSQHWRLKHKNECKQAK